MDESDFLHYFNRPCKGYRKVYCHLKRFVVFSINAQANGCTSLEHWVQQRIIRYPRLFINDTDISYMAAVALIKRFDFRSPRLRNCSFPDSHQRNSGPWIAASSQWKKYCFTGYFNRR